jgi:hypothetical protein
VKYIQNKTEKPSEVESCKEMLKVTIEEEM